MARIPSSTLTDGEHRLMRVLWDRGEATVLEIQELIDDELQDSTIRTLLSILEKKGHVTREKSGRAYVYRACLEREESRRKIVRHVVDRFFGRPADLMLSLVEREELTSQELELIKAALRKREQSG